MKVLDTDPRRRALLEELEGLPLDRDRLLAHLHDGEPMSDNSPTVTIRVARETLDRADELAPRVGADPMLGAMSTEAVPSRSAMLRLAVSIGLEELARRYASGARTAVPTPEAVDGWVPATRRAELGHPLELVVEPGGDRWHLAGRPLHAGDGVELLLEDHRWCTCDETEPCARCDGARAFIRPRWVRVRFEYQNGRGGSDTRVILCPPIVVTSGARPTLTLTRTEAEAIRLRLPRADGGL